MIISRCVMEWLPVLYEYHSKQQPSPEKVEYESRLLMIYFLLFDDNQTTNEGIIPSDIVVDLKK